jgi:SAM-dependent methyltransferase
MIAPWELSVLIVLAAAVLLYYIFGSFAWGAGYQPSFPQVVARMLELAEVGPNDLLFDPGAGTGALVFRAARERGARAVGIEIEPTRVAFLRLRRFLSPARERIEIRWENIFRTDYRPATVVAAFLWPDAMRRLAPLLEAQLAPGTRVVSHWHEIPGWTPSVVDRERRVYLYRVTARVPGAAGTSGGK